MPITALDLLAVTLATGAVIDVWHNGSIFATARAYVQAWNDSAKPESFRSLWTELLLCPFCKSYHIPVYLFVVLLLGNYLHDLLFDSTN
jgi:ABC-type spermidine/putrescine transport system permease subunit I